MADDARLSSEQIKHLELIQHIVARLGNNSFLVKGWALTIAAGFLALFATRQTWTLAAVGLVPLLSFWGLDAVFLRQERMYRRLYELVRSGAREVPPMSMDFSTLPEREAWCRAAVSGTLLGFYGTLAVVGLLLISIGLGA
jgi:hypothetical protein